MADHIPFNRPYLVGTETANIEDAVARGHLAAGGDFAHRCERWLESSTGSSRALLTHSCSSALEGAALLAGVGPGDEVVMPSFTFVSTATAFALRGATPVFVDIDPETLNLDPARVADAITPATKAIVPVHYAGVGCDMDEIEVLASARELLVIEDAAQGLLASYRERPLGSIGQLGTISFHETKNVTSGEGGALFVNSPELIERAELVWSKGTNRSAFERGEVARYTWVDIGASFGIGEVTAAFLWGQLERAEALTDRRLAIWARYHEAFGDLEDRGVLRRPVIPPDRAHNAHMYYVLAPDAERRTAWLAGLNERDVNAVFHYVPLHSSPAGLRYGRAAGELVHTDDLSARLLRLPLWTGMTDEMVERVIAAVGEVAAS